jgi:ribosomal protein S12 methylthiotransferase
MDRVVTEARRLAALGVRELIIIAQDSTWYGLDLYGKRVLATLLKRLGEVEGIGWIRLMYAFPAGFPADLAGEIADNPRVCKYLDIPIQHISDTVLASMKRGITGDRLRALLGSLRRDIPGVALRTTLITGYPAEGEKEFAELLAFVGEGMFDRLGVFTYSQEDGTTAYPLGDPVPAEVKEERRNLLMEAQRKVSLERNQAAIGTTMRVLVDEGGATAIARSEHDAPEVDNEVTIHEASGLTAGEFADVTIVDAEEYDLFALPAKERSAIMSTA